MKVGAPSRIWPHEIAALALTLNDSANTASPLTVTELRRKKSVRTFACAPYIIRTDSDAEGLSIPAEILALRTLASALSPAITPPLHDYGAHAFECGTRPYLAYPFVEGRALTAAGVKHHLPALATLYARLHSAHVMDLLTRFPRQESLTLLDIFKRASERLRAWLMARESEGLPQDALTESLFDVQRRLRAFVIARDVSFLNGRKRVLCHGSTSPEHVIVRPDQSLWIVGFQDASFGDAAQDLAQVSRAFALSSEQENVFLSTYFDVRESLGRPTLRFLSRYFARKTVGLFADVTKSLEVIRDLKSRGDAGDHDIVVAIEGEIALAEEKVLVCLQTLGAPDERLFDKRKVRGLGRLVALEDVWVRGRHFRIAIEGLAYSGKTEVGSALARRLSHAFLNTQAIARAIAHFVSVQHSKNEVFASGAEAVKAFFSEPVRFEARPGSPYYFLKRGEEDLTHVVHASTLGADILDDDEAFGVLKKELSEILGEAGLVVEGPRARELLKGRVEAFYLSAAHDSRRARLIDHRENIHHSDVDALLTALDDKSRALEERTSFARTPRRHSVELGQRSAPEASLTLLRFLLPASRRKAWSGP